MVKKRSANGGCLGSKRRRRTWNPAKSSDKLETSVKSEMSEWGNPAVETRSLISEYIGY